MKSLKWKYSKRGHGVQCGQCMRWFMFLGSAGYKCSLFKKPLNLYVHTHVQVGIYHMCHGTCSFFSPFMSQESNSGYQAHWQASLLAEPPHQPSLTWDRLSLTLYITLGCLSSRNARVTDISHFPSNVSSCCSSCVDWYRGIWVVEDPVSSFIELSEGIWRGGTIAWP